jgi:uncharacterized SAM-binding protein YcdF (DUF218 family)
MNKLFILIKLFSISLGLNLITGLISFIILIKSDFNKEKFIYQNTSSIVVATGGSNRILRGVQLIEEDLKRKMLITGVGKGISKIDIASAINANKVQTEILECCVDLDLSAKNTQGNAYEAGIWLKKNNLTTSFLVTANYHMPRLILEFSRLNPKINLNIIPVKPDKDPINNIYLPSNFLLISKEFLKFILTKTKVMLI